LQDFFTEFNGRAFGLTCMAAVLIIRMVPSLAFEPHSKLRWNVNLLSQIMLIFCSDSRQQMLVKIPAGKLSPLLPNTRESTVILSKITITVHKPEAPW
jgi:hypothetical protein